MWDPRERRLHVQTFADAVAAKVWRDDASQRVRAGTMRVDSSATRWGKNWVFTSDDDVNTYRDSYSPFWHEPEEPIPSAAVAPDGVEQVQAVVKIANNFKIPLWIISTRKNLGYGGSAPLLGGSMGPRLEAHGPDHRGQRKKSRTRSSSRGRLKRSRPLSLHSG